MSCAWIPSVATKIDAAIVNCYWTCNAIDLKESSLFLKGFYSFVIFYIHDSYFIIICYFFHYNEGFLIFWRVFSQNTLFVNVFLHFRNVMVLVPLSVWTFSWILTHMKTAALHYQSYNPAFLQRFVLLSESKLLIYACNV